MVAPLGWCGVGVTMHAWLVLLLTKKGKPERVVLLVGPGVHNSLQVTGRKKH